MNQNAITSDIIIEEVEHHPCSTVTAKLEELEAKVVNLRSDVNRLRSHIKPRHPCYRSRRSDWDLFHGHSLHRIVIEDCNGLVFAGGTDLEVGKYNGKNGVFMVKVDTRQYFKGLMAGDRIHSINGINVINEPLAVVLEILSSIEGNIGLQILRENVFGTSCRWFCSINQNCLRCARGTVLYCIDLGNNTIRNCEEKAPILETVE